MIAVENPSNVGFSVGKNNELKSDKIVLIIKYRKFNE